MDDGGLQLQAVHNVEGDEECTAVIRQACSRAPGPACRPVSGTPRSMQAGGLPDRGEVLGSRQGFCCLPPCHAPCRLPPEGGVQPLTDAKGTAWVAQEVLFSMGEQLRETKRKLEACEQRCPASQQLDDITAFLAASQAAANGAGDGDGASPAPPNVALGRRKQPEPGTAPVSGSAAKGPRPVDAAAAASGQQPASTQLTGGMSTQSGRTDISEKLKPTKVGPKRKGPNPVATKVGRRR